MTPFVPYLSEGSDSVCVSFESRPLTNCSPLQSDRQPQGGDMSVQARKRERPAASEACNITTLNSKNNWHNLWLTDKRGRSRTHDSPGSYDQSPNQSSSFEIDDATFLECLVNDMGSPPEVPRHLFTRNTSTPDSKITKADNFSTIKAKSMPDLLGTAGRRFTVPEKQLPTPPPKPKPTLKNSFMFMLKKPPHSTQPDVGH